jgi:hypothetical protein
LAESEAILFFEYIFETKAGTGRLKGGKDKNIPLLETKIHNSRKKANSFFY